MNTTDTTDEQQLIKSLDADLRWIENCTKLLILSPLQLAQLTIRIGVLKKKLADWKPPETLDSFTIIETAPTKTRPGFYIDFVYTTINIKDLESKPKTYTGVFLLID